LEMVTAFVKRPFWWGTMKMGPGGFLVQTEQATKRIPGELIELDRDSAQDAYALGRISFDLDFMLPPKDVPVTLSRGSLDSIVSDAIEKALAAERKAVAAATNKDG
jgi:hypothetical protein